MEQKQNLRAGIYIRLASKDSTMSTNSIDLQRMTVALFLGQHPEINVANVYIDNGKAGTNFDRPGFQQMLSDIEAGIVNCVIVKDLSRLGRNIDGIRYYTEQYFEKHDTRFKAINDNYDTASEDGTESINPLTNRNVFPDTRIEIADKTQDFNA